TRAMGTPGYDASVEHVADRLAEAGLEPHTERFTMPAFFQDGPTDLAVGDRRFEDGRQVRALLYSPPGNVAAPLAPLGLDAGGPGRGGGCLAGDWGAFPAGSVALLQPGPCFRRQQVLEAQDTGAIAVIFWFAAPAGSLLRPTLIDPAGLRVPVVGVSQDAGGALASSAGRTASLRTRTRTDVIEARSVLAEVAGTDPERVIVLGGHLDSVIDGPGVNDNGSGVALLLALADALSGTKPEATIRFEFWGGEELGLWGSNAYVDLLGAERDRIGAYLNLDMVGSPNFARLVYDDRDAAEGSEAITRAFLDHFAALGLPADTIDISGRADHGAFQRAGIPTGGLFSEAEEVKRAQEAARYGGTAGEPYDACYHQACDRLQRVDVDLVVEMAAATLAVTADLAGLERPASMAA
ncbi:MAG TPA: M20/M25/M40 family metallo-hydrolase, partial [Actinomycetota bacterium]|nr:M20/M25/M40 family metallo-hydrolase [Actinomycetota bacterium]